MSNKRAGVLVFLVGLTIMALSAVMGKVLQTPLFELGMTGFQQAYGAIGMVPVRQCPFLRSIFG